MTSVLVAPGAFHLAAAVLAGFDPDTLRPFGQPAEGDLGRMLEDSTVEEVGDQTIWTLTNGARQRALTALGTRERMAAALAANTPQEVLAAAASLQLKIGQWLERKLPTPESELSLDDLREWRQVLEWFSVVESNPQLDQRLARAVKAKEVLQPFRQLSEHFHGRREELAKLERGLFGDVARLPGWLQRQLPALSLIRRALNRLEALLPFLVASRIMSFLLRLLRRRPIMVYGPGGVGKSSLIAKFIVDSVRERGALFVYLDFDQQGLMAETPWLALEAIEQLKWQLPDREETLNNLAASIRSAAKKSGSFTGDLRLSLIGNLALPGGLLGLDRPLLLVLDTFEEVQKRGRALQESILEFLEGALESIPGVCAVIVGRDALPESTVDLIRLKELEWPAAEAYLVDRGISDASTRRFIYDRVGGTPLHLRLAATLVLREGQQGLNEAALDKELIAGRLYRRILAHIDQDDVRKIAHPGLVLRRITPELIREVLSGPCGLGTIDEAEAERLFGELSRQVDLVTLDGGALRHRQDVRRDMLRLLRAERGDTTRQIEELAVTYYASRSSTAERAEEIYHLLSLGRSSALIDARWNGDCAQYLRSAVDELDGPARSWLAARVGGAIGEAAAAEADLETWERYAARTVSDYLGAGKVENAIATLNERRDRSANSPLREIEIEALLRHGEVQTALDVARKGLLSNDPLPFAIRCAEIEPKVLNKPLPDGLANRFDELAGANTARPVEIAALGLQLIDNYADQPPLARRLSENLHAFLKEQSPSVFLSDPTLCRRIAAQLGEMYPGMAGRILTAVGLDEAITVRLRPFMAPVMAAWDRDAAQREAFQAAGSMEAGKMLDRWLAQGPIPDAVAVGFSSLLKQYWLIPEREELEARSKLRIAANAWRRQRGPAFLLSGTDLARAEQFEDLSQAEEEFLRACREQREQYLLAKAEKAKKWSRRNAVIAFATASWGLFGLFQAWRARQSREELEAAKAEALRERNLFVHELARFRPALLIRDGRLDQPTPNWRVLEEDRALIEQNARAVGRMENSAGSLGTAFLVTDDIVITLINVVSGQGSAGGGDSDVWRANGSTWVNFRAEVSAKEALNIPTRELVWRATTAAGLQVAAFRLQRSPYPNGALTVAPSVDLRSGMAVYLVSHPRREGESPDELAKLRLADARSGVKRVTPGFITEVTAGEIAYDCFASEGSEGAPVIELSTNRVVAVHAGKGRGRLIGPLPRELSRPGRV